MAKAAAKFKRKITNNGHCKVITVPRYLLNDGVLEQGKTYFVTISENGFNGNGNGGYR